MSLIPDRRGASRRREDHERDRLFDLTRDLLAVAGLNGVLRLVNPSWERLSGWTEAELTSRPLADFLHYDEAGLVESTFAKLKTGGSAATFEARLQAKTNVSYWLLWSATPDVPNDAVYITAHDIRARKMAEAETARFAAVVKSSNDAIMLVNMSGMIESWNPSAERVFGYKASEAIGKPLTMLLPRASMQARPSQASIETATLNEPVIFEQAQRKRKDGLLVTVALTVSPVKDAAGQVVATSVIAREVGRDRPSGGT